MICRKNRNNCQSTYMHWFIMEILKGFISYEKQTFILDVWKLWKSRRDCVDITTIRTFSYFVKCWNMQEQLFQNTRKYDCYAKVYFHLLGGFQYHYEKIVYIHRYKISKFIFQNVRIAFVSRWLKHRIPGLKEAKNVQRNNDILSNQSVLYIMNDQSWKKLSQKLKMTKSRHIQNCEKLDFDFTVCSEESIEIFVLHAQFKNEFDWPLRLVISFEYILQSFSVNILLFLIAKQIKAMRKLDTIQKVIYLAPATFNEWFKSNWKTEVKDENWMLFFFMVKSILKRFFNEKNLKNLFYLENSSTLQLSK